MYNFLFKSMIYYDLKIKNLEEIDEISIFLASNSSKSKIVSETLAEYIGQIIISFVQKNLPK